MANDDETPVTVTLNMNLWIALLFISGVALAAATVIGKKKKFVK